MFSALNVIRPGVAGRLKAADIELSQCYVMFFEKLEKANLFLDAVISTKDRPYTDRFVESLLRQTTQDGQNWLGFVQLVEKYGVVPKSVMPETYSSSNTGHVNHVLSLRLKRAAVEIRRESAPERVEAARRQALQDVYRILVMNLGAPPEEFEWRYEDRDKKLTDPKKYTPRRFFSEFVGEVLGDYCALYSIPTLDFGRKYEIDLDKTVSDEPNLSFVNVPLESLKDFARASLLDSNVVWFGCDVGQQSNLRSGLMIPRLYDYESLYGMSFELSRRELFETYSSTPTHNMVFTGLDIVDGKVRKWLVENSWGTSRGTEGYFTMLDGWFDDYVQEVVVRKKYVSPAVLDVFNTAATVLPPWDPMLMGR
jgi:bleomycin hydrolase